MTCFENEKDAIVHLLDLFGHSFFSVVMDSYDYMEALESILPAIASVKTKKGGLMVLRPDSGEPVTAVLQAL
jgi:nicotinamide phosphoribosyltransferase